MLDLSSHQPLLVFGGPYSNLRAAEAMKSVADRLSKPPSRVICMGDLVGAEPEETARLVRECEIHVVAGNCEGCWRGCGASGR